MLLNLLKKYSIKKADQMNDAALYFQKTLISY